MEANENSRFFNEWAAQDRTDSTKTTPAEPGLDAGGKKPPSPYGAKIAQTALQSIGLSTRSIYGPFTGPPKYALAVSIPFTKATEQTIMLGTEPRHVLSTSLLWNSLLHDSRFKQVAVSDAAPGDIIIKPGWDKGDGFAGIVVDHGRIVSMGTADIVQNNCSLLEIQRNRQDMALFRYIGVQRRPSFPLANVGYNPEEPRLPAGQPGGGQWTSGGAQNRKGQLEMAPSATVLSGGNRWTPGETTPDLPAVDAVTDYLGDVAEVWKGYGDAITDTVVGMWNVFRHPVNTEKGAIAGVSHLVKDPIGTLKAIGQHIADDFTSGDPRKAGKLVGQALIALAGTEFSTEKLASLLPKVEEAAAGEAVGLTTEEAGIVEKLMSGEALQAPHSGMMKMLESGTDVPIPRGTTGIRTMMANITVKTDKEVALLRLTSGTRVFRLGGPDYVALGQDVETVIAHTHPGGILEFSDADVMALTKRGQLSSVLIDPQSAFGTRVSISGNW